MKILRTIAMMAVACLMLGATTIVSAREFRHPGLLHSTEDLARIARLANEEVYPSMLSYEMLRRNPRASFNYKMNGPYVDIARDGKYGRTKAPCEHDCNASYYNALMWQITGDERHADKSMEILRAYSSTLKAIHGHDAPLCAGLQGFMMINAAEIMRYTYTSDRYENGWTADDTKAMERMLREAFLPVLERFVSSKPYANGNWGGSVNKMRLATGIFLDDEELYDSAVEFFLRSRDNGSLPNYIAESGQIQESGRDQAHCMLGVGVLAELAECAWKQGDDLYGALDNRIMKGYEYLSKVNLGYKDVPFFTWKDATGRYCNWTTMGEAALGEFRAVFEIAYNHYVERCGLEMPYTAKVLQRIRPEGEGWTCDNAGFGTLLFYLGEEEQAPERGKICEMMDNRMAGWRLSTPKFRPVGDELLLTRGGIEMQKRMLYNSEKYPYVEVIFKHLPKKRKDGWLRMTYSVNSAPEYWTFSESDAVVKEKNRFVFAVADHRSNNGTEFGKGNRNMTLILDFGDVESVGIVSIKSIESVE